VDGARKDVALGQSPQVHQLFAKVASLASRKVVSCLSVMALWPWAPDRSGRDRDVADKVGHDAVLLDRAHLPSDPSPANQLARPEVAARQRWDLLDPVLATGTPASLHRH
jgi:hypothetical protein